MNLRNSTVDRYSTGTEEPSILVVFKALIAYRAAKFFILPPWSFSWPTLINNQPATGRYFFNLSFPLKHVVQGWSWTYKHLMAGRTRFLNTKPNPDMRSAQHTHERTNELPKPITQDVKIWRNGDSGIQEMWGFGIQNRLMKSGIHFGGTCDLEIQNPRLRMRDPLFGIRNPRVGGLLDSFTLGDIQDRNLHTWSCRLSPKC